MKPTDKMTDTQELVPDDLVTIERALAEPLDRVIVRAVAEWINTGSVDMLVAVPASIIEVIAALRAAGYLLDEADIRADERERLAKKLEAEDQGWLSRSATVQETVKWLRSQGGEDE